ncbi:non-ribosomal peptide synthetase [Pseudomonas azotoformans]|uniref:Non-ribosomal peptide synthetase n=1 Tax=Pseudomonas azotoformans TaxID=47878 RepID=A0A1V2J4K0_PSEAZ|nr:non-ribosomal peptide synthetase [Pseudomonas azotoformans]OIN45837.1 non-ribosomal peptide synthetase [Pseudomonas azotoformans]ONH40209.1 non-ribosomal peptide synthetase [Pseudomonas azotoformans]SDN50739.1 arthrofactin-type cyclic lipopeptide synthetase A [Pseudomonas azotoformans]
MKHSPSFPLTAAQQDIWLDQLRAGDSPLYNIGGYVDFAGAIDPGLMQRAVERLVARHDALRTQLHSDADGLPRQTFAATLAVDLALHDVSKGCDPQAASHALMQAQMARPYAMQGAPLFRFFLVKLDDNHYRLGTQAHHLILDGWGFGQMLQSLAQLYTALAQGRQAESPAPSYIDFIDADQHYHASARYARDRAYWLDKYRLIPEPLLTPRHTAKATSNTLAQAFPVALLNRMEQVANRYQASAFHVLLAALYVYFTRTAQRQEWVVGLPILNRSNARFRSTVGLFTQVSAVRLQFDEQSPFSAVVRGVRDQLKQDFRHQRFPLSEMNRELRLRRSDRGQLFDLSVSFEQDDHELRYGTTAGRAVKVSNHHEPLPLALHLRSNRYQDTACLHCVYNEAYFQHDEVAALAQRLTWLLEQGLEDTALTIRDFSLVTPAEQARLQQWNATAEPVTQPQTLHARIEAQAARAPDAIAAVYQGRHLSYAQLNQQANALAHQLLERGVRPDDRVVILARRGLDTLVGLLAILKSGACYVPVDPAHPAERLNYLLQDSDPVVVLTQHDLLHRLPPLTVPVIQLDRPTFHLGTNPRVAISPSHLAYVIYTSGSTGLPKGVMVEHHSVSNLVDWHCRAFDLHAGSHTASVAGFGFDAMAWEVWPALCVGATLHLPPAHDGAEDIDALLGWWQAQPLDVCFLPTPVAEYAFSQGLHHPTLRTLLIGGDRLRAFTQAQSFAVINNYGPTEATVVATSGPMAVGRPLHIGAPVANATVYVLDAQQRPLPIGVAGELYVGGKGIARGYLKRPDLSAERFLDDPFTQGRMYRTGDLVRWLPDGNLEYLGRNDDQVKIRGVRIELGEIESALATHPHIQDAVVQAREGQLLAWFVPREAVPIEALRAHLQASLPDYMLPAAYVQLDVLPLTANGKLDRKALPAPTQDAFVTRLYEAPHAGAESVLAQIWAELLQVQQVGRHDHFFELGGHSLLAVQLVQRMRQVGLRADVQVLFGQPTLAALAAASELSDVDAPDLAELDPDSLAPIVARIPGGAANVQDIYPLAPLQEGLLYHHITDERDPYQQQALFSFAQREQLDAFAQALQQVINRHDILRTSLVWEALEQPMQVVWRQAQLRVEPLREDPAPLDLRQAPLMALDYAEEPQHSRWVARLRFHHLVNDATSTTLLMQEIRAHLLGQQAQLPVPVPYRNVVVQARSPARQAAHEAFFREQLGDVDEPTLAFGLQERQADRAHTEQAERGLSDSLNQRLRAQARGVGVSTASLFHLAWAQVLSRVAGRDDVVFGTVLLGRLQAGEGADRALGMFINTLPLRVRLAGRTVADALTHTHVRLSALLAHEQASLALAQRCSGASPLFNSLLNYRHTDAERDLTLVPGIALLSSEDILSYPLMLTVDDTAAGLRIKAKAPHKVGAERLLDYLETTLVNLADMLDQAPQTPLRDVQVLPADELKTLLVDFNATDTDYPDTFTVQALFEAHARHIPHAIAVQAGELQLTYRELNERANQLAFHLRERGVQPDARVALCVERGLELVVGLLAILKAGGAYVPLDPGYPRERLAYMLHDSQPVALLVHAATRDVPGDVSIPVIDFDHCAWSQAPVGNPLVPGLSVANLAYVMYTSGSTGTPKGVMIEHRGLGNLMHWGSQLCPNAEGGALLQRAPFSFDGSVWELFWPLTNGMRLVLARPDGHREPAYLAQVIREQQITVIKFVPAMLQQFLELEESALCTSLTDVLCGGGELTEALAHGVQARLPKVRLHNVYGPTEATVDSSAWTLEPGAPVPALQLPIGRAINNTRLYVLDEHDAPVPMGVSGQLHIGGVGVARGYLGLQQMTAERFIDSPFVAGDRLYRTGDLVRYLPDGNLEFLGRNDFQVKLRGVRLELGEIESRLLVHPALREVAVLIRDERLVAYFTVRGEAPSLDALRAHVLEQLPEFMVPAAFVQLDALPLNPAGKLDRKALPEPGLGAVVSRAYAAPVGAVEVLMAGIWAELLKLERVGRHDHFFELGGHSLLAVNLVARMRKAGVEVDARALFSHPTVAQLAGCVLTQVQRVEVPQAAIPQLGRRRRI